MPESRMASALLKIGLLYLIALCGVVAGLVMTPVSVPLLMALRALITVFFMFSVLTAGVAWLLISVRLLDRLIPGFKAYLNLRMKSSRINRQFKESSPARIRLSAERLNRLCPDVASRGIGFREWLVDRCGGKAALRYLIADQLWNGDSRAAVVVSLAPLRVAAYSDKLDAIALLKFPDAFVAERGLRMFGRLVSVNRYFQDVAVAADLDPGPLGTTEWSNFRPFVADFLCDDEEAIRTLRAAIREDEWKRATFLGRQYLERFGDRPRDGQPLKSLVPAKPGAEGMEKLQGDERH